VKLEIVVYGDPQTQGNKTPFSILVPHRGEKTRVYILQDGRKMRIMTNLVEGRSNEARKRFQDWRENVKLEAQASARRQGIPTLDGPLAFTGTWFLRRPKSVRTEYPDKDLDLDKLARAVWDSLKDAGVIVNDSRFVDQHGFKRWAKGQPCVLILIETLEPEPLELGA
jgi:Holliday junction resolvase RusA-like endonuclease